MNVAWTRYLRGARLASALTLALLASACQLLSLRDEGEENACCENAKVCKNPTVRVLASDLDDLESHIEKYGSVVPEQPSVWGQARLTKHREEFENQMLTQLSKFDATLQGSLSQSDQAYAADALSLSFTAQAAAAGKTGGNSGAASTSSSSSASGKTSTSSDPIGAELTGAFAGFDKITRNDARLAQPLGFGAAGKGGVSLEPTVYLDQMKRYLDHLHELRRINEGDDTVDSPGYSLNLVRIPVSVLPGARTEQGHGAEITMTLTPHLHDELLPMTFRNLVINDLVEQIGVPMTQFVNDPIGDAYLNETKVDSTTQPEMLTAVDATVERNPPAKDELRQLPPKTGVAVSDQYAQQFVQDRLKNIATRPLMERILNWFEQPTYQQAYKWYWYMIKQTTDDALLSSTTLVSTPRRRAIRPFPASQLIDIYGIKEYLIITQATYNLCSGDIPNRDVTHYADVQAHLQEELNAAYRFLATSEADALWCNFCRPELVTDVRSHDVDAINQWRCLFERQCKDIKSKQRFEKPCDDTVEKQKPDEKLDATVVLSWAIIVDSALLNDQLVRDMKEASSAKGGCQLPTEWLHYFHPRPKEDAKAAFNEYVKCRWPIHVFALDPVTDEQNIADTYSSRREMQLAMSLAFVSGGLSANNMMRYARRLETEIETIALNSKAVGFSHGSDTFGWRFYPRFQTPDTEGNATVFFKDLLIGGPNKDALLRQRRLEPGVRECVAIVMMPSFVPYCDMDSASNWFQLDNPRRKVMDSTDAVTLSAKVKTIQSCAQNVGNAGCYRDGELDRLYRRSQQLETRLPLQSTPVQVPYENTLGGFAMFNSGVTDLAPELLGWYGAPAINLDAPTTLFLIGDHFSVHQTRVLAGGQEVAGATEMLSRQVMKVIIPTGTLPLVGASGIVAGGYTPNSAAPKLGAAAAPANAAGSFWVSGPKATPPAPPPDKTVVNDLLGPDRLYVDIQLATPYGVTGHLLVPAAHISKAGAGGAASAGSGADTSVTALPVWTTKDLALAFAYKGAGIGPADQPLYQPKALTINLGNHFQLDGINTVTLKMTLGGAAKGDLKPLDVVVTSTNYNAQTHVLTIADTDLSTMVANMFLELQYQFGPETTKPPGPVTVATTVTGTGIPDTKLFNTLQVSWIKSAAAGKPATPGS